MKILKSAFILSIIIPATLAQADLYTEDTMVSFSSSYFVENVPVTIYAETGNNSTKDLLGTVKFWNDTLGKQIGTDQPISVIAGQTDTVFIEFYPTAGTQQISVSIYPWDDSIDDTSNNTVWKTIYAEPDSDGDWIPNSTDNDDDNDGTPDEEDAFPTDPEEWKDTDGDGEGNNIDNDDDNDGTPDEEDEMPEDFNETQDTDKDGIGNKTDTDDDGDTISDEQEISEGTDPLKEDTDGDKVADNHDAFPIDPTEWKDFDKDGIGDNADPDDDNDTILGEEDVDDNNKGPTIYVTGIPKLIRIAQTLSVDASSSFDEDGEISTYEWAENGKILSELPNLEISYDETGKKILILRVTDDKGESRIQEITINVYSTQFMIFLGLILVILLSLAFYAIFRYSPPRKKNKEKQKSLIS
ncbi:MAG: PKD domain-containing protein [Patescibacteria group bacterium]|nr:PKD domain-containing protein [Patescibacteria group bacterium]